MEALRCLPGVGPKSAQRMAFTLLQRDRSGGMHLAQALTRAMSEIGHCADCRTFTEQEVCNISNATVVRKTVKICAVESPADIYAIEQTGQFSGRYFVLMGHLSPLDGIGPDDIGLDRLEQRLAEEKITEVILATNPTVEGEATANYIAELCAQYDVEASRIAHGVPVQANWKWSMAPRCHTPLPGVIRFVFKQTRAGSPALACGNYSPLSISPHPVFNLKMALLR